MRMHRQQGRRFVFAVSVLFLMVSPVPWPSLLPPSAGIRRAQDTDLEGVDALLQPLVKAGVLVGRTLEELAELLPSCTVIERDNKILGCAVLLDLGTTPDGVRVAEVGAFCVDPQYRCAHARMHACMREHEGG